MNLFHRRKTISPIVGVAVAAAVGLFIGWGGQMVAVGLIGAGLLILVLWKPELGFIASILTMIVGQLIRLPILGGDNAVIINDLLLPALILVWAWRRLISGHWPLPRQSLTLPIFVVIGTMILSLVANSANYFQREVLSGALYQIRWIEYAFVFLMAFDFLRTRARAWLYVRLLILAAVAVAVLGFLQLQIFPDFTFMVPQGWDPHVGRLLSTWFDPNFLAGWLALLITISLAVALALPWSRARWWWAAIAVMTVAVVLTFSRSGYVALVAGAGVVAAIRSRAIFFLGLFGIVVVILFVPRVQERVIGIRTVDETAQLRIVSWENALTVIHDHPWLGVGYNLYRYVQVDYGFLNDTKEHSASGSDSSLLTIWVTTGIIGLVAYLWLFIAMLRETWRTWRNQSLAPEWRGFGLGLMAGLLGLLLHAQFVNSLFYPHIMQTVWILLAAAIMVRQPSTTTKN